ncbi:gliding motility-associated C-terminal domain-containing protein [Flagellimonas sp.]|uniref:gliding motility-associated C-terminal domain-containing protein n=1 Tax=Flagellimonas sp. TaxID=2058762 RepID=UPI003F49BF53
MLLLCLFAAAGGFLLVSTNDNQNQKFFSDSFSVQPNNSTSGLFVPNISLIKTGTPINLAGDPGCDQIRFDYYVTNESDAGEIFENVEVTDIDLGGLVTGGFSGDDNDNKVLDPGETWAFSQTYNITQQDLVNGQFGEMPASVVADVQGLPNPVNDISHPTDNTSDGPTIVDLTACQTADIALRKTGTPYDLGGDLCPESIRYVFEVRNTGAFDLHDVALTDPLISMGPIPGPTPLSDIGNDGILSPGETWVYNVLYAVVPEAVVGGNVHNQASVKAVHLESGNEVSDDSHDADFTMDGPTTTPMDETCDAEQATIGLIKTHSFVDLDNDSCFETIRYEFTATNTGDVALDNLVLHDPLFENTLDPIPSTDIGNDGELSLGETWTFEAFYAITLEDIDNGFEIVNQATIQAQPVGENFIILDDSDDNSLDENDATVTDLLSETICVLGLGLVKKGEPIDLDEDGCNETIQYTFTVKNTGTVNLEQIVLNDPLLGGDVMGPTENSDINNDGILSGQEEWTYVAYYPIIQGDIDTGSVTNQATVTSLEENTNNIILDDSDDDSFFENDETVVTLGVACVASADIGLIKTAAELLDLQEDDNCPETIPYTFTVSNTGSIILKEVQLTDELLGGIITGLDTTTDENEDGLLFPNETWTYEALYPISSQDILDGEVVNQAEVSANEQISDNIVSDQSDDNSFAENEFTITPTDGACAAGPAIGLIKEGFLLDFNNDDCFETIRYVFTVANIGTTDLEQVVIEDIPLLGDVTLEEPLSGEDENEDGILSVGEDWEFEVLRPISQADIDSGQVDNQASVSSLEFGTNNQISDLSDDASFTENNPTQIFTDGTCPAGPGIGLIKEGVLTDLDNDNCPEAIQYTFTVTNFGTTDLVEVSVFDPLISGNQAISGPLPGEDEADDNVLSIGETWRYEALYILTPMDIDSGQVENQATLTALEEGTDFEVSDASHDTSLVLEGNTTTSTIGACDFGPGISLIKVGELLDLSGNNCPDTVRYTFIVKNIGTTDLTQIELVDTALFENQTIEGPLPGTDDNDDAILSVGEDWVFVALYPILQEDIDLGQIENQATVTAVDSNSNNEVSDLSDFESEFQDRPTITIIQDDCLTPTTPIIPSPDGDFEIYNGLTPNGDGLNDYFTIKGIENYPENNLKVFNRWGVLVYEANQYGIDNNLFGGISFGRATIATGKELPSGTYYYVLSFFEENPGQTDYNGYLYINRD